MQTFVALSESDEALNSWATVEACFKRGQKCFRMDGKGGTFCRIGGRVASRGLVMAVCGVAAFQFRIRWKIDSSNEREKER